MVTVLVPSNNILHNNKCHNLTLFERFHSVVCVFVYVCSCSILHGAVVFDREHIMDGSHKWVKVECHIICQQNKNNLVICLELYYANSTKNISTDHIE